MKITGFIERNKPIFVIGVLMATIFGVIIISSRLAPKKETGFKEVNEMDREFYKVAYENQEEMEQEEQESQIPEEQKEPEINMDEIFGVVEISYTEEGFIPRVLRVRVGQNVNWTNKTERTISIKQIKPTYDVFTEPVEIKPNESFKFPMTVLGIWTYNEVETEDWGSVEARPLPTTLPEPKAKTEIPATEDLDSTTEPATQPVL